MEYDPLDQPIGRSCSSWCIMLATDPRDRHGDILVADIIGVTTPEDTHVWAKWKKLADALGCGLAVIDSKLFAAARRHDANLSAYPLITYDQAHARIWRALRKRGDVLRRRRKEQGK